ncbi:MAG: TetR/AcrR family transcriptional regulator [Ktedonobacteraceae bacterium]
MSPRTEETNQHIRDEQKRKILDVAAKVFARKGYAATKMADIASEAEISYGLAYHYFTNKETLFSILVEHELQGATMLIRHAQQLPGTPWERIHTMVTRMLDGMSRNPEAFMVVQQAMTNDAIPAEIREITLQRSLESIEAFKQLIIEGQMAGQVTAGNPDRLAIVFSSCIQGLAVWTAFLTTPTETFPSADDVLRLLKP